MERNSPVNNTCDVQIRIPPRLTSTIDIAYKATAPNHPDKQIPGALISIDLNCPLDLFYGYDNLAAKFYLAFKHGDQSIGIQDAKADYFRLDNNIRKLVTDSKKPSLQVTGSLKKGTAEIIFQQPEDYSRHDSSNIRIVLLLDAYPSSMEVRVSLSTAVTTDGIKKLGRAFTTVDNPYTASYPDEKRLQELLRWTAGLGYEKLFEAYLDHVPFGHRVGLNEEDEFGMTPFSWAALTGNITMIQLALQHGGYSMARRRTTRGPAPLEAAARGEDSNIFDSFLKLLKYFDALVDKISGLKDIPPVEEMPALDVKEIETELNTAVRGEQIETIRRLVQMILDKTSEKSDKEAWVASRMVRAAEEGHLCLVRVLINAEVDLKADPKAVSEDIVIDPRVDTEIIMEDNAENDAEGDTEVDAEVDSQVNTEGVTRDYAAVKATVEAAAEVLANTAVDSGKKLTITPLMSAIDHNKTKVAEFLIIHGTEDQKALRDALRAAVKLKRHNIIRTLLQVGTLIEKDEDFKKELLGIASVNRDSTALMLLKLQRFTGKLATFKTLDTAVDKLFEATVVNFCEDDDPEFEELNVHELMRKPEDFFKSKGGNIFKWYHLPANNMKWAEALIGKIYQDDPSSAYKVLEPKRWVKRQHEGKRDSAHARFMMPACHDFSEAFKNKKKLGNDTKDKHVVLFMPYLHWDEEETMNQRSKFIADFKDRKATPISKEDQLLTKYLLSEDDDDPHSRHVLHIRRTLDQSVYHNLKDTKVRDADQTVQRYQKDQDGQTPGEKVKVIMVDQLWLWILVGQSGKAETIITCFPSRDWSDVSTESSGPTENKILNERHATDVLQITKSYIQHRPNAVKTPYDLAGLIASRCSRALLDHSADMLNFAEVYENSISSIMNQEATLFNTFNSLMQTRTNAMNGLKTVGKKQPENDVEKANTDEGLAKTIMKSIQLQKIQKETEITGNYTEICKKYRQYTLDTEIPSMEEIKMLESKEPTEKKKYFISMLEKFGRFYVLDITKEITLLRQIKDIEDELEMMEKVFADQKEVLEAMDRIIRMMVQPNLNPDGDVQTRISDTKPNSRRSSNTSSRTVVSHSGVSLASVERGKRSQTIQSSTATYTEDDSTSGDEHSQYTHSRGSSGIESQMWNEPMRQNKSMIWDFRHQKQNLPLRTVRRHSEQIQKMAQRAKNTNSALSTLVELKQKQNNMIDTRTARLQAEQSHIMTLEAEKQGKTLMVFTIVTIVFLPLSFIAAFFAIPTKEFADNTLTLGFVSKITFPASVAISLLFIAIGFSVSKLRRHNFNRLLWGRPRFGSGELELGISVPRSERQT